MARLEFNNTQFGPRIQVKETTAQLADMYLLLQRNPNFTDPITMRQITEQGFDPGWQWSFKGQLWQPETGEVIPGRWEMRASQVMVGPPEDRWEIRWGFAPEVSMQWYGFTAILDLNAPFSNKWHDGIVFATTGGGFNPNCNINGDHVRGFAWLELHDGQTKFQRGPITFPEEWHHPNRVETSADFLTDINCVRTIELGWFTGKFREHFNLPPVSSPLFWQGTELLRVGWW